VGLYKRPTAKKTPGLAISRGFSSLGKGASARSSSHVMRDRQ
jgi:hypothetical protein